MIQLLFSSPVAFMSVLCIMGISIALHEFAHAYMADKLGDPTPRAQGRVTLNPLAHLDILGTLLLVVIGFGWGKPVQYDPYNLRRPHRDAMYIALAGPVSNIIIVLIATILAAVSSGILIPILTYTISLNLMLAFFNLIPIAPLDGFRIVAGLLSDNRRAEWLTLERLGPIFLLLLLLPITGQSLIGQWLTPFITMLTATLIGVGSIM
jgi:Zn-dependent protease